jgi:hypothetical protein
MPRQRVLFLALALMLPFAAGTAATAGPPVKDTIYIDETHQSSFWTGLCGVPVFIHNEGTVLITYVPDSKVIHEVDLFPGWTVTVSSPVEAGGTGKSFSYKAPGLQRFLYPEGTEIGASSTVITSGVFTVAAPGGPVIAGREVDTAVIVEILNGIPFVEITETLSTTGNFPSDQEFNDARCAFLTDP